MTLAPRLCCAIFVKDSDLNQWCVEGRKDVGLSRVLQSVKRFCDLLSAHAVATFAIS